MFQQQVKAAAAGAGGPPGAEQKRGADIDEEVVDQAVSRIMWWSLDTRVRPIEGQIGSFFLADEDKMIVPSMLEAIAA